MKSSTDPTKIKGMDTRILKRYIYKKKDPRIKWVIICVWFYLTEMDLKELIL